jgi:Glycosyl transferase family 2
VSVEQVVLRPDSGTGGPAGTPALGPHQDQSRAGVQVVAELECSVGIMAYNEEANIAKALDSVLRQDLTGKRIKEVIVVASGCDDRTVEIVADIATREPRVRLIEQAHSGGADVSSLAC